MKIVQKRFSCPQIWANEKKLFIYHCIMEAYIAFSKLREVNNIYTENHFRSVFWTLESNLEIGLGIKIHQPLKIIMHDLYKSDKEFFGDFCYAYANTFRASNVSNAEIINDYTNKNINGLMQLPDTFSFKV